VGDKAKLRFTAINNRDNEAEKLLSVSTDSADAVHLSPPNGVEIAPNSSITAGESTTNAGGAGQPSLDVTLQGMRESLKPGMSVDVTFGFEMAGEIKLRTPVEACPREVRPGQ
jgi:copper(I)-binding protein